MSATKRLFVGNLPFRLTSEDLREEFEEFGVTDAHIVRDRGFGFVEIKAESLDAAIQKMDGKEVGGREMRVNEAKPRPDRPDRPQRR
ncbi:RNA-binding protein [Kamptonema cortianum]|nr:RNA-binding protein [Geitlerinema splendidum]MDK3162460.1 RNA-binding protein [Kamptonema cortianum]